MMGTWGILALLIASGTGASGGLVTLRLDDGTAENGFRMGGDLGHAVVFEPPAGEWTIKSVGVYGKLEPNRTSDLFVLEIWDGDLNAVSKVTERADSYFGEEFGWAVVDLPDVQVSGPFLVALYEFGGVFVGTDLGPATNKSLLTARNPNRILRWELEGSPQNETEWMIRALGSSPAPEVVSLKVLSGGASPRSPAGMEVELSDPDENLRRATLYLADDESGEVVWSDFRELEGGEATAEFSWPGTAFQVSDPNGTVYPVLPSVVEGVREELQPILARSLPCVLLLDFGETQVPAYAYFGEDGKLNALIDQSGSVHYASRQVLNATAPGADYVGYVAKNVTASRGDTAVAFYKVIAEPGFETLSTEFHELLILSRSPLFNYRVVLEEVEAMAGVYVPIVLAEDEAYNAVWFTGPAEVRII
ncbi:hypothetical protein [Methanothrix harundinacea]|uniref:Uncharacterized protein n=1 Tax=Methanothrix harundinacea (strain 6Ac) TaxID=1110509 RepID=G7WPR1_METH6|nr:hypothetical protein [Methanothrix harundinacea]AET65423.1 hypothetical protein Mhar_2067 [Methanothrix harundinacea 6Ac]